MSALSFAKYEGLGNDFVVVEANEPIDPSVAMALCDRHFGVGADGALIITPAVSAQSRARMVVLNADGSRPEMCGNGLRCVALHLALAQGETDISFAVDTDAGPLRAEVAAVDPDAARGPVAQVTVAMGRGTPASAHSSSHQGQSHDFRRISMGNPHAILFDLDLSVDEVDAFGAQVSAQLEGGSNVEFVTQSSPTQLNVVVWERGVGRTLACGTGACAVAVAAALAGRSPYGETLQVTLPGGTLGVKVAEETLEVSMTGPARRVFHGEVTVP